jgi:hypothetical protein
VAALKLEGLGVGEDTARDAFAAAYVAVSGSKKSGTSITSGAANANLFAVQDNGLNRMLVDLEGDLHLDATSNTNVWDEYDDVALVTAYRAATMPEQAPFRRRFGELVEQHRDTLVRTGVLSAGGFVSFKALTALMIDAIRQLDGRVESRLSVIERRLSGLPARTSAAEEAAGGTPCR